MYVWNSHTGQGKIISQYPINWVDVQFVTSSLTLLSEYKYSAKWLPTCWNIRVILLSKPSKNRDDWGPLIRDLSYGVSWFPNSPRVPTEDDEPQEEGIRGPWGRRRRRRRIPLRLVVEAPPHHGDDGDRGATRVAHPPVRKKEEDHSIIFQ